MKSKLLSSACAIFLKLPFYPSSWSSWEKSACLFHKIQKTIHKDTSLQGSVLSPKDQVKSLGPTIPSKGLQAYGKQEGPN